MNEPALVPSEPPVASPVPEASRNKLIDALRGMALLGILMMNIPVFALPNYYSESFKTDPTNINFWFEEIVSVLFEGKMRALFGMIFGAGVVLFVSKKEQAGRSVTGLFYRRMMWMVLFGLVHAHLVLWLGDILYLYGFCGMIVYLCRNIRPKYLAMVVPLVALLDFSANTLIYQYVRHLRIDYVDATRAVTAGEPLTGEQQKALEEWRDLEKTFIPNRDDVIENTRKMKSDYPTVASYVRKLAFEIQTKFLIFSLWDSIALMLLGIALYRWGFITGEWSDRSYRKVMLIGYGLGIPLVCYTSHHNFVNNPNMEAAMRRMETEPISWIGLIYPFQRILLVMAHVSLFVLVYKSGRARGLFARLEAVGQMAFTNYIMHSVICSLFFFGYGLNYYGELQYYQLFFVVGAIWILQLIVSPLWLRFFRFGPLEWLWRCLTYWKIQPIRRQAIA